jgi:hypothetical protein
MLMLRDQTAIVEEVVNWYNEAPVRKEARWPLQTMPNMANAA